MDSLDEFLSLYDKYRTPQSGVFDINLIDEQYIIENLKYSQPINVEIRSYYRSSFAIINDTNEKFKDIEKVIHSLHNECADTKYDLISPIFDTVQPRNDYCYNIPTTHHIGNSISMSGHSHSISMSGHSHSIKPNVTSVPSSDPNITLNVISGNSVSLSRADHCHATTPAKNMYLFIINFHPNTARSKTDIQLALYKGLIFAKLLFKK